LSAGLAKVSDALRFDCGPRDAEDARERMLGADGLEAAIPLVDALLGEAPRLARWRCTAFQPWRDGAMPMELARRFAAPCSPLRQLLLPVSREAHDVRADNGTAPARR